MFNQTWLYRYLCPHEVVLDNIYYFKRDFITLLNYFSITPICTSIKNPQSNAPVEHIQQVIYKIIFTKELDIKVYDYIEPWRKNLASVECGIRASYHITLGFTPVQTVFGRYMLFNLMAIVDWRVVTARKQRQAGIDNFHKKSR